MRQSEPYVAKHDHEKALLLLLLLFKRWKVVIKRKDKKKNSLGKEKKNRSHLNVTAFSILVIILTAHDTCGDTLVSLHICGPQLGVAPPPGGHLVVSGGVCGRHDWGAPAMLPLTPQCPQHPPHRERLAPNVNPTLKMVKMATLTLCVLYHNLKQ